MIALLTPQSIELSRFGNWSGKKANIEFKLIMITGAFEWPLVRVHWGIERYEAISTEALCEFLCKEAGKFANTLRYMTPLLVNGEDVGLRSFVVRQQCHQVA